MNWKKGNKDSYYTGDQSPSFRNRDPKKDYKAQYVQNLEKSGTESGSGEMIYIDPNDDNYRRNPAMSPVTGGRTALMRSPQRYNLGQSILNTVRNDLNDKDTSQNLGRKPIPPVTVKLPSKYEERLERSPKTINIGESEKEIEYNLKTLQGRRSPKGENMYQISTNEQGNVFLDPPIQSDSFNQADQGNYPSPSEGQTKKQGYYQGGNTKEIQYIMNPRDARDPMPNIMNKMSPNKNIEDENSTDNKGYETQTHFRDYKRIDKDSIMVHNDGDGMIEGTHQIKNEIDRVEDYIKVNKERNTLTDGEIKKLVKQITHGYDPRKGTEGRLISTTQTIMKGNDEIFNDRYRVLQKMNKLSTILLSKNKADGQGSSMMMDEKRKTFDRKTLNGSTLGTKDHRPSMVKTPHQRFLFLTLAMLSSKGPHCEDRIILRKMRFDKGGVVDLAQDQKTKTKFQVKKLQKKKPPGGVKQAIMYNPKHREKAAKIVQGWWREMKSRYTKVLEKIILIQSIWRGRWLRKYIYDIIYISYLHQRFCDILEKVMVSHIRPIVWEDLFGAQKNAKDVLAALLMKDKRWTYLRLKPFFNQWRNAVKFLRNRNLKSKNLVNLRELNEEKKKELSKHFREWLLRANLLKYIGKAKDAELKKQKFFGVLHMISGATALSKRNGLTTSKPHLERFLFDKIRSRAVRALLLKKPKYSLVILRKYFNKWNANILKMHMKDLRESIFSTMATRLHSRLMKNNLRRCFNNWKSKLPKNKETLYARGKELLEMFANRRTHKDAVKALKEKEDYLNAKDRLLRLLGVKSRYIRHHWRDYLYKWRTQAQKLKDKEIKNKMYTTLLNTVLNKRRNRILSNRFSKWRKTPKLDLEELFNKYKGFITGTERLVKTAIYPTEKDFFARFQKTIGPKAYKLALKRLLESYLNKDRMFSRYYLYRWREQCKNLEIYDLKVQLFRYLCGVKDNKTRKGMMNKGFNKWKINARSDRLLKSANKNYKASQGLDKLNTLFRRRPMDFLIRLHKRMNKDYRPKYIEGVARRLFKPRATPSDCFAKWKRVNDISKADGKVRNLKGQILKANAHRLHDRLNRDAIIRSFFKWLNQCRNPENYYPRISDGINKLDHLLKKKVITLPFQNIRVSKNYARKIVPLLRNNKKLQERLDKDALRSHLNKWKSSTSKDRIRDLKSNIIFRTKNNVLTQSKGKILTKYFTRWKMYRPKGFNADWIKGLNLFRNFCEKPYRKPVLEAFKEKLDDILKRRGLNTLFGASKTYTTHLTHLKFRKWYIQSKLIDPNKATKIKTRIRSYVKDKEYKPLDRYFKRWLRALVKNPNFVKIVEGSDILKSHLVKRNRIGFKKIQATLSHSYVNSAILKKLLPNSKVAKSRVLRSHFDKWLSKANKLNTQSLKGALLSQAFNKGKGLVKDRVMRIRFKKWATKEPEKKPIDLYSAIQGNEIIYSMLAKKYLVGFLPKMKDYGSKKFLKSLLFKSSKYHLRVIKPILDRWRTKANKIQSKALAQDVSSRLMAQSKKNQLNSKTTKLMTDKISQWRLNARDETRKIYKNIPDALKFISKFTISKNYPEFINRLKQIQLQNKKTTALKALPPKREKFDKANLKTGFVRYKNKTHKMQLNEVKDMLKRKYMTQIIKRMAGGLLRYFLIWRNKSQIKHSDTPLTLGCNLLRLALIKDSYKTFIKRADMMNLHIPRGLGLKKALVNKQTNIAKSIGLRNIAMRPGWNTWKRKANALKNKAINRHIFNKIILEKLKSGDILFMRRGFNQWRSQNVLLRNKEKLKELQMKLMSQLYDKNGKAFIKRFFDRWEKNAGINANKLKAFNDGMLKLQAHVNRPVVSQMRQMIVKQSKFDRIRAMLANTLRKNDRDNLAFCFNKWKKNANKLKEMYLKAVLLRNLSNKQDQKSDDWKINRLHEALLTWRIKAIPKDYLSRIEKIRQGGDKLKAGLRKPYEKEIFDGINDRAHRRYAKALLYKLFSSLNPKFNERLLRNSFREWASKLKDTDRLRIKFNGLMNRYLLSEPIHNKMIKEPEQDIVDAMHSYDQLKRDKAQTINSYCRGLLNIIRQFNILKRNKFLHYKILSKDLALGSQYNIMFKRWVRATRYVQSVDDAKVIQRFLKNKMNNPADKRKRIVRGGTFLDKYVKKVVMYKIAKEARDNLMKKVMKRHINNQDNLNKKMLSDRFKQWYNLLPYLRKNDAAKVIQNNYRNLRARRKVDQMMRLNSKMRYLVLKLFGKYLDKRKTQFQKWLHETQETKCDTNARTIQKFTGMKLRRLLKGRAMAKLQDMFRMNVIKQLTALMAKASRIIGDKGAVMYNTLEDIYIRRPFDKLLTGMKWISRIAMLRKIKPMIYNALRNYFLPPALRRWKQNTWDDKIRKIIQIQNWIRIRMMLLKERIRQRREALLGKYLLKLANDKEMKLAIPFKIWDKKTKFGRLNDQATAVQKVWKGSTSRKKVDRLLNQHKLNVLFKKSIFNTVADAINNADQYASPLRKRLGAFNSPLENRYATNNLIDFANDILRNKYLFMLTGKRAYFDGLSDLRRKFDKWRRINRVSQEAITKIQNAYRSNQARNKRRNLERLRDRLLYFLMHAMDSDQNRLNSAFKRWNLRSRLETCNHMSIIIQDYLCPKLEKLLDRRFQNFFEGLAKRMTAKRLNQGAKVNKLKNAILGMNLRTFLQRLDNKLRAERIRELFLKRYHTLDDELLKMYLYKYFNQWRNNANALSEKLNSAALFIQRNFKGYLARLFLAKLKNRRARVLKILLKLINDKDIQKQITFNLWRTNAQALKLDDSSKVIQDFMDDIKKKMELRKKNKRAKRIQDGLNILCNLKEIKRDPFNKIKSESNRKIFTKMNETLIDKRKDHLNTALKAIKDKEKENVLNKLFKIPPGIRNRILRKAINIWKDNATKLGRKQAAEMIQRNYRLYMERLYRDKINKHIRDILAHLTLKYSDLLRYYFNKWQKNAQKAKLLKAGNKITRFIDKKYNNAKVKRNWNKLADLLNIRDRNYGALNLMKRIKMYKACQYLIKPIEYRIKEDGFALLLDQIRRLKLSHKLQLIFNNFEKRQEILTLLSRFNHWRDQARKLKERDEALEKAVNTINTRKNIIGAETIGSASLIAKLFRTIPKIRAIDFYDRLRKNAEAKKKLENLSKSLVKMQVESGENDKAFLIQKVYRLYIYRIMNKMFDATNQFVLKKVKPAAQRDFLMRLQENVLALAHFNYNNSRQSEVRCPTTSMTFKSRVTNPKNRTMNADNSIPIKKLMPYFVDYLGKKVLNRKRDGFNAIRADFLAEKFCGLYKIHSNKKMLKPKKELYDRLKEECEYRDTLGDRLANLFKLFRKGYIRNLRSNLDKPSQIYKLMYCVRMTVMHKRLAKQRFIREVVRKWRFLSFVKKMARKKLEMMYKNLHVSYLQMANEVFGDEDEINPSVVKEFERFGSTVGMFSNEEPQKGEDLLKQYYKTVQKKYVFDSTVVTQAKSEIVADDEEEIEENSDFYVDEEMGEGTTGKYRSETHKSNMKDSTFKKPEEK